MMLSKLKLFTLVLMLCIALFDQLTKHAILTLLPAEGMSQPVTSFFNLVLVYNRGISFGLFNQAPVESQPYIFIGIAAVVSIILLVWLFRTQSPLIATALGLIIGGAIGNGIDRVLHGAVVDFIDVYVTINATPYHWPAFNVADSAIVCGVGLLLIDSLAFDKKKLQK